ncbi:hypothetical protein GGR79_001874 [Xanthomonas arboricola]|nr:hypothetical protein [Xanthomonas arboricola]
MELIWLTGRLAPDFKTTADFRKGNGAAIVAARSRFTALCRRMKVFSHAVVAIDGSKFKAVNSRDRNFTVGKIKARRSQLDESVARYLAELDRADRDATLMPEARIPQLRDKLANVQQILACEQNGIIPLVLKPLTSNSKAEGRFDKRDFIYEPAIKAYRCPAGEHATHRFTSEENGLALRKYWSSACPDFSMRDQCTPPRYRRISRWEHEHVLDSMQVQLDARPQVAVARWQTVEHVFGTLKAWLGTAPLLTKALPKVRTEISLTVLAYNMKRMIKIICMFGILRAIAA